MEVGERSQRYCQILCMAAKSAGALILLMSLIRYIFYFLTRQKFEWVDLLTLLKAFAIGVRFDLSTMAFIFIPLVTLLSLLVGCNIWSHLYEKIVKFYMMTAWTMVVVASVIALPFYLKLGRQFRFKEDGLDLMAMSTDTLTAVLVYGILFFILLSGWREIWRVGVSSKPCVKLSGKWKILYFVIPIFVVALVARGSLGAHHLEKEDAEISPWENLNELPLTPIWAIDKY